MTIQYGCSQSSVNSIKRENISFIIKEDLFSGGVIGTKSHILYWVNIFCKDFHFLCVLIHIKMCSFFVTLSSLG